MQTTWKLFCAGVLFGCPWLGGCGGSDDNGANRPAVAPVSGTVTLGGKPVPGATVTFQPKEGKSPAAYAKTDKQGRFTLGTFKPNDGAVPGEYQVTVQKFEIVSSTANEDDPNFDSSKYVAQPPKSLVPEKYTDVRTSDLTASVTGGQKNHVALELNE